MIISASRRTDIPAYYSDWFFERLRQGQVLVRNPMNRRQVSRIFLHPDAVTCIVFWTKNPQPMMKRLPLLSEYPYYFQFTLNPYGKEIEPGVPSKAGTLIDCFHRLAQEAGPERVVWRYDPILLSKEITPAYHLRYFERLAGRLEGSCQRCTVSFLDVYPSIKKRLAASGLRAPSREETVFLAAELSAVARSRGMEMTMCAEDLDLDRLGVRPASCIDPALVAEVSGTRIKVKKDKNQRSLCGCIPSVDIGAYRTCPGGCVYCYANQGRSPGGKEAAGDPSSPLLTGLVGPEDVIRDRRENPQEEMVL